MRIGQFSDAVLPIVDGVSRVVVSYAQTLAEMGHDSYVVAASDGMKEHRQYAFQYIGYQAIPLFCARQYKAGVPMFDRAYHRQVDQIPFDILHVHAPFMAGREALRLKKKLGVPLVGSFHSKYYDDFYKMFRSRTIARIGARWVADFYKKCDLVFAVSQNSAEVLRSYGYDREVLVIPNGTDLRPMQHRLACEIRGQFPGKKLLLFVGQLNWKKNILRTLEVAAELKHLGEPIQLILAGQGPDHQAIVHKADELGLHGSITFTGHISDRDLLDGYYEAADLFLFPSIYDNAPMVVREAAAMGTPSLLIEGSSAAEHIENDGNGFLCPDETEAITRKTADVLHNPALLKSVGESARKTIPIPWEQVVSILLKHYEALMEANRARREGRN